jgi:hypothetical protein
MIIGLLRLIFVNLLIVSSLGFCRYDQGSRKFRPLGGRSFPGRARDQSIHGHSEQLLNLAKQSNGMASVRNSSSPKREYCPQPGYTDRGRDRYSRHSVSVSEGSSLCPQRAPRGKGWSLRFEKNNNLSLSSASRIFGFLAFWFPVTEGTCTAFLS